MNKAEIRSLLQQVYDIITAKKQKEQHDTINSIQLILERAAKDDDFPEGPFPVERKVKIASLFVAFCNSGDPVTESLVHAFSLLINP